MPEPCFFAFKEGFVEFEKMVDDENSVVVRTSDCGCGFFAEHVLRFCLSP